MPDDIPDVLTMERVTKVYGTGDAAVKALDDVDFEANIGEVTVIMGPSGSGKTTFLTTRIQRCQLVPNQPGADLAKPTGATPLNPPV